MLAIGAPMVSLEHSSSDQQLKVPRENQWAGVEPVHLYKLSNLTGRFMPLYM